MMNRHWFVFPVAILALVAGIAASLAAEERFSVGDELFKMTVALQDSAVVKAEYEAAGRPFAGLESSLWSLETDSGDVSIADSANVAVSRTADGALVLSGKAREIDWSARCETIAPGTVTVRLSLKPEKAVLIKRVFLFNGRSRRNRSSPRPACRTWPRSTGQERPGCSFRSTFPIPRSRITAERPRSPTRRTSNSKRDSSTFATPIPWASPAPPAGNDSASTKAKWTPSIPTSKNVSRRDSNVRSLSRATS